MYFIALDYLEAEASRGLSAAEKQSTSKQRSCQVQLQVLELQFLTTIHLSNRLIRVREIKALTEVYASKLTDINSLIDNHIVVNRYIIKGLTATGK